MKHRAFKSGQHHPRSKTYGGQYGRLFRQLSPLVLSDDKVKTLVGSLSKLSERETGGNHSKIPAGYTYFGQFIDHDITFDPVSFAVRNRDPDSLINVRTPSLDLDSLYGGGPDLDTYFYTEASELESNLFILGNPHSTKELDLFRRKASGYGNSFQPALAIIPDPRNDEHLIISQMHLAFQLLHNKISSNLSDLEPTEGNLSLFESEFSRARRILLWHYQWLIVNDYLPRICSPSVLESILGKSWSGEKYFPPTVDLRYYDYKFNPYIPLEFSGAAFRFGHSMVRSRYQVNETLDSTPVPIFTPSGSRSLTGLRVLRSRWSIQWNLFLDDRTDNQRHQFSNLIDPSLSIGLGHVPMLPAGSRTLSLIEANINRGLQLRLPSGQAVARLINAEIIGAGEDLVEDPLWLYILKEAMTHEGGKNLGTVGSTIVAETLIGLLLADKFSYVNMYPGWKPFLTKTPENHEENMCDYSLYDLFSWGGLPMTKENIEDLML